LILVGKDMAADQLDHSPVVAVIQQAKATHRIGVKDTHRANVHAMNATLLTRFLATSTQIRRLGMMAPKVARTVLGRIMATASAAHQPPQRTVSQIDQ
jgi:hypothetical protein